MDTANAQPQKRLFLELITRDITLEDAILDLIDNSVNSILQREQINLTESFDEILNAKRMPARFAQYKIDIRVDEKSFQLMDNCGGIGYEAARTVVFQFGRASAVSTGDTLSVYGIGLKRALFKLGDSIDVQSSQGSDAFQVKFSARKWASTNDWVLPLSRVSRPPVKDGTSIVVNDLHAEVRARAADPGFYESLERRIRETYCFFIGYFCNIVVNGHNVPSERIQIGTGEKLQPAVQRLDENGVVTILMAGLAPRDRWVTDKAGWYIFCNARAVVFANKSELTGWTRDLPQYVSKYRGFLGIVFFFSKDPERLPWTTTKTDINEESLVFQRAMNLILITSRPVLSYLNSLYGADEVESVAAKAASEAIRPEPVRKVTSLGASTFQAPARRQPTTLTIQFPVKASDIEKIRRHLRNPALAARKIGELAFKYYLENEVGS